MLELHETGPMLSSKPPQLLVYPPLLLDRARWRTPFIVSDAPISTPLSLPSPFTLPLVKFSFSFDSITAILLCTASSSFFEESSWLSIFRLDDSMPFAIEVVNKPFDSHSTAGLATSSSVVSIVWCDFCLRLSSFQWLTIIDLKRKATRDVWISFCGSFIDSWFKNYRKLQMMWNRWKLCFVSILQLFFISLMQMKFLSRLDNFVTLLKLFSNFYPLRKVSSSLKSSL